jgi:hypothetical protein
LKKNKNLIVEKTQINKRERKERKRKRNRKLSLTVKKQMFFGKRYKQSIGKLRAIIHQEVHGGAFRK